MLVFTSHLAILSKRKNKGSVIVVALPQTIVNKIKTNQYWDVSVLRLIVNYIFRDWRDNYQTHDLFVGKKWNAGNSWFITKDYIKFQTEIAESVVIDQEGVRVEEVHPYQDCSVFLQLDQNLGNVRSHRWYHYICSRVCFVKGFEDYQEKLVSACMFWCEMAGRCSARMAINSEAGLIREDWS